MLSYRTEIVIAADRYVCLQLPEHVPEGRATITVHFPESPQTHPGTPADAREGDPPDIEWWEEFEGERS